MNRYPAIIVLVAVLTGIILFLISTQSIIGRNRPKLIKAKDGPGIIGYKDTPILPRCGTSGTTTPAVRDMPSY